MKPKEIIIHCSATKEGHDYTVEDIDRWHKARGFKGIGYHYVIYRDGTIVEGRPLNKQGAHCTGHNKDTIGICYIGGLDYEGNPMDTRTISQENAMINLVKELMSKYPTIKKVSGHNKYANKACPSFDVDDWMWRIGL